MLLRFASVVFMLLLLSGCEYGGYPPDPAEPPIVTTDGIFEAFKNANLPVAKTAIYSADTDPNHLLGRPNSYTGKVSFRDTRLATQAESGDISLRDGGSIEIFWNEHDATNRLKALQGFSHDTAQFLEYDYQKNNVLLRLNKALTVTQAAEYKKALDTLP